jgi:hypothetical protein
MLKRTVALIHSTTLFISGIAILVPQVAFAQAELERQRDREEAEFRREEPVYEDEGEYEDEDRQRFFASASIGIDYSRGDYGEPDDTDFLSVPVGIMLEYEPITFRASVPFLYKDGVDDVILGIGGAGDDAATSTEAGIGDVVTSLAYTYYPDREYVPTVDLITKVKIPTASKSKGLGTGHTDVTLQTEITETIGPVSVFGGVGYRFKGGSRYDDIVVAGAGASLRFARSFSAGVAYDFREAATSATDDSHEIVPFMSIRMSERFRLGPYAVFGLSDGSPDYGGGLTLTVDVW